MNIDYIIRLEKPEEFREVENLVRESFWNVYRPGCSEHYVIHVLRGDPAFVKELDLVMELDGRLIAYTLAEPVNDDLIMIHYEKGLPEFHEVYQVINKDFCANDAKTFKIANREEDMGDEGLRHAKLAYGPCGFVEKYDVHWKFN